MRALARAYGETARAGQPVAIRLNYGMQRVRGAANDAARIYLAEVRGATLAEAEMLALAGAPDVLIAFNPAALVVAVFLVINVIFMKMMVNIKV